MSGVTTEMNATTVPEGGYGLGLRSVSSSAYEKAGRVSWGRRDSPRVLVTVGTVSRTEEVAEQWDAEQRYSSDVDVDAVEMRRQWPRLAKAEPARSEDAHSENPHADSLHYDDEAFVAVHSPAPARPHLPAPSPWVPQTPDSPYPGAAASHPHVQDDSPWRAI
jgi:hypothetical protein